MDAINASAMSHRSQRGYTLIEIMVALLIAVFLIGGILTVVQDNRRTFGNQKLLSQLQDQERLAMMMFTNVIEAAGYYPDPTVNASAALFPAAGSFAAGQFVTGSGDYTDVTPNSISVRFATKPLDNILRCNGTPNTGAVAIAFVNTFSVKPDPDNNNVSTLFCTLDGTDYALVSGVTNLQVLYGVRRASTGNSVDSYVSFSQMSSPADFQHLLSVKVTLTFTNPMASSGSKQPATITFTRVIGVMGAGGITTAS